MKTAILAIRPAATPGTQDNAATNLVRLFALDRAAAARPRLVCHWYQAADGRLVCAWEPDGVWDPGSDALSHR
jgi:hypothetical protein